MLRCVEILLTPLRYLLIGLIILYRMTLSKIVGGACRFEPTCSLYFLEALKKWGFIKGCFYGIGRILRCHPFGGSGYDPVP